jgi:hypothetical protein
MADQNIELADLVTAGLNAADLGFTATRCYLPVLDRSNLDAINVFVIPASDESEIASRVHVKADYKVDIGLLKSLVVGEDNSFSNAELDGLMLKVRAIKNWLKAEANRRQEGEEFVYVWHKTDHTPLYFPEHLESKRQFTSFVTANYRATET